MEISNHGGLLPGVTIEQIKAGFSEPRNPVIAEVLYRCEMIEKWGRGIPEIIQSCKTARDPEPEFVSTKAEFKIIFKFPKSINPSFEQKAGRMQRLTERQLHIVQALTEAKELRLKELMHLLKLEVTERTLRRELANLRNS